MLYKRHFFKWLKAIGKLKKQKNKSLVFLNLPREKVILLWLFVFENEALQININDINEYTNTFKILNNNT